MSSSYKLIVDPANAKAFKILVAAEFAGQEISVPSFDPSALASPLKKVPYLETPKGILSGSYTQARFVAGHNRAARLFGAVNGERALVDSWCEFCEHELEMPATVWVSPVLGLTDDSPSAVAHAKQDLAVKLGVLESRLKETGGFLVGKQVTLADICCVCVLVYPFKFVAAPDYLKPYPSVVSWFQRCTALSQFKAVVGQVSMCTVELKAGDTSLPPPPAATATTAASGKGEKGAKEKGGKGAKEKGSKGAKKQLTIDTKPEKEASKGGPVSEGTDEVSIKIKGDIEVTNKEVAACCVVA